MPRTWKISIDQVPGQSLAVFNPASLPVAVGDLIFWSNNTADPHWPSPAGKPKDFWFDAEIPGKLPDQPAPTSSQISFASAGPPPVSYVCALHPQMTGEIVVT
jgi:plastocyanin